MKKLLLVFSFIFLFFHFSFSQNLVPNQSFEDTAMCPPWPGAMTANYWWLYSVQTPDYFHPCAAMVATSAPANCVGYQNAASGIAYAGFYSYAIRSATPNYREIMGVQLISPLIIGQKYFISMKVSRADSSNCATNNMGILFSNIVYTDPAPPPLPDYAHLYSTAIIADAVNWTAISGAFIADSAYQFLNIGNFFTSNNTDTLNLNNICNSSTGCCPDSNVCNAYYYVDDICVSVDSATCGVVSVIENPVIENLFAIYPNPATETINVSIKNNFNSNLILRIYSSLGVLKYEESFSGNNKIIPLHNFSAGVYFLQIENQKSKATYNHKFIVAH